MVGHSGGGATAISLALDSPRRVRALLLLAPGVTGYPWPLDDLYFADFTALLNARDHEGMIELGMRTWAPDGGDAALEQIRSAVDAFLLENNYEEADPPAFDRLGEIAAPTTVMIGERDHPMVAACADAITDRIRDSRKVTILGADHMLPLRSPDLVVQHIRSRPW